MNLYLTKTPRLIQKIYTNYTWRFSSTNKEIYLTFDDGPTPEITPWVLSQLQKHQAKATFFCIGKNIEKHPEIFKQILADGHAVGNHTHNHLKSRKNTTKNYVQNTVEAAEAMDRFSTVIPSNNEPQQLFRPPYGKITASQAKALQKLGYTIVMWDVLSADFDTSINTASCLQNVLKNTEDGSIVVFHDSVKAAKNLFYALPKVLEHYSKKGFEFKKIKT